ncbi:MAG: hypothetical protein V2A74_04015, partial [bacterium]
MVEKPQIRQIVFLSVCLSLFLGGIGLAGDLTGQSEASKLEVPGVTIAHGVGRARARAVRQAYRMSVASDKQVSPGPVAEAISQAAPQIEQGLTVRPPVAIVNVGETKLFEALDSQTGLKKTPTWSAGVGTISSVGLFTAPSSVDSLSNSTLKVTATDSSTSPLLAGSAVAAINRAQGMKFKSLIKYLEGDGVSSGPTGGRPNGSFDVSFAENWAIISDSATTTIVGVDLSAQQVLWVWDPGVVPGTIVVSQSSDYFFFRIRNDQWLG